ncbi:MAG: hypothetical protein KDE33_27975 [Bacteroidetes bacterium]|nr:hypothetical protein [Bacteroidota bacterium]
MSKKKVHLSERIEMPDLSSLSLEDIPQQAGTMSSKERNQQLRVRKNVEEVTRSVIRGVEENKEAFEQTEGCEVQSLSQLLDRRQRLQPVREKLEEALYVITDAELLTNNQIQRSLLRVNEVVTALDTLKPGIARDFVTLKEYVTKNDGKTQRASSASNSLEEDKSE